MYSMILAVDHQEIGKDPKVDNNRIHLWFYMLILFVNNIIIWNILIGVVVNNFWKLKE